MAKQRKPATVEEAEERIYIEQERLIRKRYGKKAAGQANYGWGVDGDDDYVSVATKVYEDGGMVLLSEWSEGDEEITHEWREY